MQESRAPEHSPIVFGKHCGLKTPPFWVKGGEKIMRNLRCLFLVILCFFFLNSGRVGKEFVEPVAVTTSSDARLSSDAPTETRQESPSVGAWTPENSPVVDEVPGRVRDSRRGMVRITGHVPPALAGAERLPDSTPNDSPLTLTVVLNRTDQQGFEKFLSNVQDPRSPLYRHYLTPREQANRFGPSWKTYAEVSDWLRRRGFRVVEGSANRLTLTVRGTLRRAEQAFGVQIDDYRSEDRAFYAHGGDPAVPGEIAPLIQAVVGFSSLAKPNPSIQEAVYGGVCGTVAELKATNAIQDCQNVDGKIDCSRLYKGLYSIYYTECLYDPSKHTNPPPQGDSGTSSSSLSRLKVAEIAGASPWRQVDGTGQKVGLLEFDTFDLNDIRNYLELVKRPTAIARLSQVHVNGGATRGPEETEVLLDIVAVLNNAPGADVVVYDAPFNNIRTSFQTLFNRMIGDGVTVISNSWVYCEDQASLADAQSLDSVLASAAAAGITVLNATGDFGSTCVNGSSNTASLPASSPNATAVGGTSTTTGPDRIYDSELYWNGINDTPPTGQGGFGVSRFFTRPAYQNGFTSSPRRSLPDVAVNGDPAKGIQICQANDGGCPTDSLYGGTSFGAPAWAAFVALLNQAQGQNLGALNPLLYPLADTAAFHSAASMGSDFQHVGLGSPNLNLIHRALTSKTAGAVSAAVSEVTADPDSALADGTSEAFVVVRLRDADGHTVSGRAVTLAGNAGARATVTPASGVSNVANGAVVFSVKNTTPERVTFTATTDGVVLQQQAEVIFGSRPAAAGSITASPNTVNANGTETTTITVTLQDALGNPSPNKLVNLSQGNGASIISATTGRTDPTGRVQFTAVSNKSEVVTYSAVDVTDRNLPVPGSAMVNFTNASGFCADRAAFNFGTAAPGWAVTTFAGNFTIDCFSGVGPIGVAFDANGTLLVGNIFNNTLYAFGPQGGIAGPATRVGVTGIQPGGLVFTPDGRLYAALKGFPGFVAELNPATGAVIRTVVNYPDAIGLALHPISGELFVSSQNGVARISNYANGPGTVTPYFAGDVDGITFAPDGTLYAAFAFDRILRVTGTPAVVTTIAFVPRADGIAIEANPANPARPFLYVNRLDGVITRVATSALPDTPTNPCGSPCTDIYTGGSRGDFVAVSAAGCLFATQSDRVIKITKADGTCGLLPTNPGPQLTLTPEDVQPSPAQGTAVTFTAQLKNVTAPADIPITLFVSGANPRTSLVRTDATGKAIFTYTGVSTGADLAFASADVTGTTLFSNEAKVTWTPGRHSTFLTMNLSPSTGTVNTPLTLAASLVDVSAAPMAAVGGVPVSFTIAGQTCTDTTNAAGTASCTVTANVPPGSYPSIATFSGNSQLLTSTASRTVNLVAPVGPSGGFECDLATRFTGDGQFRANDLQVMRDVFAGEPVNPLFNEFQRADCSPFETRGDGRIIASDVQQVRNYIAGLSEPQTAGGPTQPVVSPVLLGPAGPSTEKTTRRTVGIAPAQIAGDKLTVYVKLDAEGDETAMYFAVNFDHNVLKQPSVRLGPGVPESTSLTTNGRNAARGRIGILLDSATAFRRADSLLVAAITFDVVQDAGFAKTEIGFDPSGSFSDATARELGANFVNSTVSIPHTRVALLPRLSHYLFMDPLYRDRSWPWH